MNKGQLQDKNIEGFISMALLRALLQKEKINKPTYDKMVKIYNNKKYKEAA